MTDLLELAMRHIKENGMSTEDATVILETFARAAGRDIQWNNSSQFLPNLLIERIDRAAVNWMMAHRMTGESNA
jgi:hypothetical protein